MGRSKQYREDYIELTKNIILDKAVNVFLEKSFFLSTIHDISAAAEVSISTIYTYFKNKDNILSELYKRKWVPLIAMLKEKISEVSADSEDRLYKVFKVCIENIDTGQAPVMVLFLHSRVMGHLNEYHYIDPLSEIFHIVEKIIKEEKQKGTISKDLDTCALRSIFSSILDGAVYYTFLSKSKILKDDLHINYKEKFLRAIKPILKNLN